MAVKSVLEVARRRELAILGGHWPDVLAVDVGTSVSKSEEPASEPTPRRVIDARQVLRAIS